MKKFQYLALTVFLFASLCGCARNACVVKKTADDPPKGECGPPYKVFGKTYHPLKKIRTGYTQKGLASWYGPGFHGKKTSSGEVYDMHELTAAHSTFPLQTLVKVTNLENNREVVVRINDRGPFVGDRLIDLSYGAAGKLGMVKNGVVPVKVAVLGPADPRMLAKAPSPASAPASKNGKPPNPFFLGNRGWLASLWGM